MANQAKSIEFISVANLRYDPDNPRLTTAVKGKDEKTILAFLLKDQDIIELINSIGEQGYFAGEPLLVCKNPIEPKNTKEPKSFLVVEGNRRFTAVKLLNDPGLIPNNRPSISAAVDIAKEKPSDLPCIVYDKREDILDYLSYRHITGVKAWTPVAKARYVHQLQQKLTSKSHREQMQVLARSIGTNVDYVSRLLTGYALYTTIVEADFFRIPKLTEDSIDFSILTTSLSYSNLSEFLGTKGDDDLSLKGLKKSRLQELTRWLFEKNDQNQTRLGESRNLKYLNSVVSEEKALTAFRNGTPLLEAKDLTQEPAKLFSQSLEQSLRKLEAARDTEHLVEKPSAGDSGNLKEIAALSRRMQRSVDDKIIEADDLG